MTDSVKDIRDGFKAMAEAGATLGELISGILSGYLEGTIDRDLMTALLHMLNVDTSKLEGMSDEELRAAMTKGETGKNRSGREWTAEREAERLMGTGTEKGNEK